MKVALDLDKTYLADPVFNHIAERFQKAGHQVGILTSRNEKEGAPVHFTPDFLYFLNCGDLPYAERALLKTEKMRQEGIDIIFDDHAAFFPESVVALHIL